MIAAFLVAQGVAFMVAHVVTAEPAALDASVASFCAAIVVATVE